VYTDCVPVKSVISPRAKDGNDRKPDIGTSDLSAGIPENQVKLPSVSASGVPQVIKPPNPLQLCEIAGSEFFKNIKEFLFGPVAVAAMISATQTPFQAKNTKPFSLSEKALHGVSQLLEKEPNTLRAIVTHLRKNGTYAPF
jgi:hypothetical protein